MSKEIDKKARAYIAQIRKDYPKEIYSTTSVIADYTAGYARAVTDLSTDNAQLREALRELVDKVNMLTYSIIEEEININDQFFAETMDALAQAKQLLTDNTQEDDT